MDRLDETTTHGFLTTGPVGPPHPVSGSWAAVTGAPPALHLHTNARPPAVAPVERPRAVEPTRSPLVLLTSLGALAGLLVSCVSVLLRWNADGGATGLAGTGFGIGVLVMCAGLLTTVVVDLLERRVRWLALVAVPPVALLSVVLVAAIAVGTSGVGMSVQLALAGLPWPGPVISGVGVWLFGLGQLVCLGVGSVAAVGLLRGWGDDEPAATPSPRRPVVVALCALAAVLVIVISGVVLGGTSPTAPPATATPAAQKPGGAA